MDAADDYDSESDAVMEDDVESLASEEDEPASKRRKKKNDTKKNGESSNGTTGLNADDVIASMPKTDKQVRHEKRLKVMERQERKAEKRSRLSKEESGDFEIAPNVDDFDDDDEDNITKKSDEILGNLSGEEKKRMLEARKLIKAGVGKVKDDKGGFEIVAAGPLPIMDRRKYDSENEDYDSDDYARTLALGTMMLRKSKAKALVDASYNRFAWNDPSDLPDWFVDDENKHHKPQLPIPAELVAKMKERVLQLSLKPIAKVAEARARKNKRARTKLVAAKKKAESVANSSEMSEAMKLKAISKAMRGQDSKSPGKSYVISKKNGSSKGAKGVKLVDKRMKSDKRSMDRAEKKKKHGKKGGLTGSKKRRNHS
jgi:AdoMet-dependent rRNA methyltransferase SPB1